MIKIRETNIFHRVADSEVPFTELFCNLMSYKIFRECILNQLIGGKFSIKSIHYEHFTTQYRLPDSCGQPDLVVRNDDVEILIEIKINNSGLTNNQPINYLKYLNTVNSEKLLVFIVPPDYSHINELRNRLIKIHSSEYEIFTWNQIIDAMHRAEIVNVNPIIKEFSELLSSWYKPYFPSINTLEKKFMFDETIPTTLQKLFEIVDSTKKATSTICKSGMTRHKEYSLYFKTNDGDDFLFFGVWYEFWKEHHKPLVYGIDDNYSDEVKRKFLKRHDGKIIEMEGWHITWFNPNDFDDSKEIISTIKAEIEHLKS